MMPASTSSDTYKRRLGLMLGDESHPPGVVVGGKAWATKHGMIVVVPDHLKRAGRSLQVLSLHPLPPGVSVAMSLSEGRPVIVG